MSSNGTTIDDSKKVATELGVVVGLVALMAAFIVAFFLERHDVHWFPESAAAVTIGIIACAIVGAFQDDDLMSVMRFDMDFFMEWLIPPIIFEAAFNMNVSAFFANLSPILLFAFGGTLLSTFVVAAVAFYAGQWGLCYPLSPFASLAFGSLISATDPVAVLATFQQLGVSPEVFSVVFGESVLNDAVAIVLTRTLTSFAVEEASPTAVLGAFDAFVRIFVGSSLLGLGFGVLSSLTFKHLNLREREETVFLEVTLSFTFPWAAYFLAEAVEFSGIVASAPPASPHTHVHAHTRARARRHTRAHTRTRTQTHARAHAHTRTHARTRTHALTGNRPDSPPSPLARCAPWQSSSVGSCLLRTPA